MIFSGAESSFLAAPITTLRGVSSKRQAAFKRLGISTLADLLYHFPRSYEDWSKITAIADLEVGQAQAIKAVVARSGSIKSKGRLKWWQLELEDESGRINVTYFNQPWLKTKLQPGSEFYFYGKVEARGFFKNLSNPAFCTAEEWERQNIFPIYPLTEGIGQNFMRQVIASVLQKDDALRGIADPLPKSVRKKYKLAELSYAIERIHQPQDAEDLAIARRRIAFAELFLTGAALKLLRERRLSGELAAKIELGAEEKAKFQALVESLPFTPTHGQIAACNDIFKDLRQTVPMNRLLQGDVGSGKTVVALLAMYYVVLAGYQALFMAPTSILANQHYKTLQKFLEGTGVRLGLLTGGLKQSERRELKSA
ncbi:MAG: DEAD/DEAH box helicase, partial [Eubacteriales bacterium]|nr:DEAD/DEAH box helicase [Eubacteriales bacterium]